MGRSITPERYKELKAVARTHASISTAAARSGVSVSTMRRVNKSQNYIDFKRLIVADRGTKYLERGKKSTWTASTPSQPKKRKWWERLLNI